MLPHITMTGNAVADGELRFTAAGLAVLNFRVAASQAKKDDTGNWVDDKTCFLAVTVWGSKAESLHQHVKKGVKLMVSGRLEQRDWEATDGTKRTSFQVIADSVAVVPRDSQPHGQGGAQYGVAPWEQQPPF